MKAVLLREFGGPEKLELAEVPTPQAGPGEAVVRVRACALNHLDLWVREGVPAYRIRAPHVLGSDVSGELAELGPGVDPGFSVGRKIVVAPGLSCFECESCREGQDQRCARYGVLGAAGGWGGYAEFVKVPARNLLPYPEELSFEEAAAFPLAYLTAWHMLVDLGGLRAGQTALVVGAGSGVSLAGLQIAKLLGARTIVSTRDAKRGEAARAFGADDAVVGPPAGLQRAVRRLTSGRGVDVALEHVGPAVFEAVLKSLRPGGILVTCGATTGPKVELDLRYVFSRELRIAGAKMGPLSSMRKVAELVAEGKLRPLVDSVFPLEQARQAHERLASGEHFGKIVLRVA